MKLFLALALFYLFCVTNSQNVRRRNRFESCSTNPAFGSKEFKYFGASTLYKNVRRELPNMRERTGQERCSPIHFQLLVRNGARLPSEYYGRKIRSLLNITKLINMTGEAMQCSPDLQALKDWEPWFGDYVNMNQTEYGDSEIRGIARRFMNMLPELFPPRASPASYRYLSSDTEQTIQSMRIYAKEILKRGRSIVGTEAAMNSSDFRVVPEDEDKIIRFHKNCRQYLLEVIRDRSELTDFRTFMNGPVLSSLRRNVASRLGIYPTILSPALIFNIWRNGCGYQQSANTTSGPWCFPFSKKELQVMDYAYDLSLSGMWKFSVPITKKMSCNLAKDFISSLKEAAEAVSVGRFYPMGTFRFGHSTTILSLVSNFGVLKNPAKPLIARTMSRTSPSAGNLAFVLYKCVSDYKVQIFWNEKPIKIPACADDPLTSTLCPLYKVLRFYRDFAPGSPTECDFNEICRMKHESL